MVDVRLPDFPWDTLVPYRRRAQSHPGGLVDLSVGTPVDPTPQLIRDALAAAADAPGYPATWGSADLREAVAVWFEARRGVPGLDPGGVLPTIGSKEFVAWLPTLLELGPDDTVAFPSVAYPTYQVGALLARATPRPFRSLTELGPVTRSTAPRLLWVNSPGNPTGQVLGWEHLAKVVAWARQHGVVVASDECYAELDWQQGPVRPGGIPSILDPRVCQGSHEGLLAVYSLSKQSNLAGYRAAFVAGDPALVARLLERRKHAGMMMPTPVQHAMIAALSDADHVAQQRSRYAARREQLLPAVMAAGFRVEESQAGLYLWLTRDEDCWQTVAALAESGILVAPGDFYGAAGRNHVRIALTATDERIDQATRRLRTGPRAGLEAG
ncbi:MAG TPA: succinyldiaminopimelate transaminase [Dermatophilaceae bacterium]|nr:succinyldiaminopimelate transaminase [Dermatophilaceae bacterium]